MLIGPNGPASHSSFLPILEWYTRYAFQVIEKVQTENIKSFEPKKEVIKDLYNHTHELMKRLVWSSGMPTVTMLLYDRRAKSFLQPAALGSRMAKLTGLSPQSIPGVDFISSKCLNMFDGRITTCNTGRTTDFSSWEMDIRTVK